jgi:MFS family permease
MEKDDGQPRRFFYGWVVVGISGLVFAVVRGINDAFGVFLVAFVEEFGWSRAAVAGAFSFGRAVEGTVSVAVGMLSDRLGLRRLVPVCTCLMAVGLVMASRIDSLWMLYISYSPRRTSTLAPSPITRPSSFMVLGIVLDRFQCLLLEPSCRVIGTAPHGIEKG